MRTYFCPYCQHQSADWLVTYRTAWCPHCFRGTLAETAVRHAPGPAPRSAVVDEILDLFGSLRRPPRA